MKTTFVLILSLLLMLSSCDFQSAEQKRLAAQNDSLIRVEHQMKEDIDSFYATINEIERNIKKIKETQDIIAVSPNNEELNGDARQRINQDLLYLNDQLLANKTELAQLKAKIKQSQFKSAELEELIAKLSKSLDEESSKVLSLQAEIAKKDSLIISLNSTVKDMEGNIEEQQNTIAEQTETLHTGWYAYGTRSELKEQNIITSSGLFKPKKVLQGDFNKSYFVRIDVHKTTSISLYSKRAKVLTNHPEESYSIENEDDGTVLMIKDVKAFWSISKYLVVEVD